MCGIRGAVSCGFSIDAHGMSCREFSTLKIRAHSRTRARGTAFNPPRKETKKSTHSPKSVYFLCV
jgi:hypothetical protein